MSFQEVRKPTKRSIYSIKGELITKSRESALTAVQVFNNPLVQFKSETYIVLMIISWTYLLHAYCRSQHIEYRYFTQGPNRRNFARTKSGSYKYWELERCLKSDRSPIDSDTANNLRFLIGLRHEIEHQMTKTLDSYLSGRYQACALNYNYYLKKLFGSDRGIERYLGYSLQFADLVPEYLQAKEYPEDIPVRVRSYISAFDNTLHEDEYNSDRFSYRLLFTRKLAARASQADKVVEFIDPNSELGQSIQKEYLLLKEVERPKFLPSHVVQKMKAGWFRQIQYASPHWVVEGRERKGARERVGGSCGR